MSKPAGFVVLWNVDHSDLLDEAVQRCKVSQADFVLQGRWEGLYYAVLFERGDAIDQQPVQWQSAVKHEPRDKGPYDEPA